MVPSTISRMPQSITTLTATSKGRQTRNTPSAMDSRPSSTSTHQRRARRLARVMPELMRFRPSTAMNRPNTSGRKLATTAGRSRVNTPSAPVMTPPMSRNGAANPCPRVRVYCTRHTMPVMSTTAPNA